MKDVIELAEQAGIDAWWESGNESREELDDLLTAFATLVRNAALEHAMQELKVQADYSGSNRRAFYMDAIAHIRNLKEPTP